MTLGHVHLKVRDLDRAIAFYTKFLGLSLTERVDDSYAFLTTGRHHHDVALQNVGPHAPLPGRYATGLFHVAFEVPDKRAFAAAYRQLVEAGVPVGPTDHRISWALYFSDPDGNGVEVYCDTQQEQGGVNVWQGIDHALTETQILQELQLVA